MLCPYQGRLRWSTSGPTKRALCHREEFEFESEVIRLSSNCHTLSCPWRGEDARVLYTPGTRHEIQETPEPYMHLVDVGVQYEPRKPWAHQTDGQRETVTNIQPAWPPTLVRDGLPSLSDACQSHRDCLRPREAL